MNRSQPTISGRKRVGTTVFKSDLSGNQVATYPSLHIAQRTERRSYRILMAAITGGKPLNNHFFTLGDIYQRRSSQTTTSHPWETNGIFNIDAWGKLFH